MDKSELRSIIISSLTCNKSISIAKLEETFNFLRENHPKAIYRGIGYRALDVEWSKDPYFKNFSWSRNLAGVDYFISNKLGGKEPGSHFFYKTLIQGIDVLEVLKFVGENFFWGTGTVRNLAYENEILTVEHSRIDRILHNPSNDQSNYFTESFFRALDFSESRFNRMRCSNSCDVPRFCKWRLIELFCREKKFRICKSITYLKKKPEDLSSFSSLYIKHPLEKDEVNVALTDLITGRETYLHRDPYSQNHPIVKTIRGYLEF